MAHLFWLSDAQWAVIEPHLFDVFQQSNIASRIAGPMLISRRIVRHMAVKGGENPGHWPLARWPNHQNPCPHRRHRPPLCLHAHSRQCIGHQSRTHFADRFEGRTICSGRQGIRCECASKSFAQCGHGSCDPRPLQSKTQNHLRQSPLQRTPPHRKCILPSQGLSKSGNPLRQTRKKLPVRRSAGNTRRLLVMIESGP